MELLEYKPKRKPGRLKREAYEALATAAGIPHKFKNLLPWQYAVLVAKFNNPKATQVQLSKVGGIRQASVCNFFKSDRYKSAVVEYGKEMLFHLIPVAVHSFRELLRHKNAEVRLKATMKILEDSGVLNKETVTRIMNQINTQINVSSQELRGKNIAELNEMLLNQLRDR